MNYDIIGDIHGHADALEALLRKLGYMHQGGAWRKSGHKAIFVGDYIDRGPRQLDTVGIVRAMVDAGTALAVMGNHEFNAIAWSLPDPERADRHLREHTPERRRQHQAFLDAVRGNEAAYREAIDWFMTLPLWLELPGLRVVHACWDEDSMRVLEQVLDAGNRISLDGVRACSRRGSGMFQALETVLKGPEVALPDGLSFRQGEVERTMARLRWWKPRDTPFRDAVFVDLLTRQKLPQTPIPDAPWPAYGDDKPVFVGHYWLNGTGAPMTPHIACLDYSVVRPGNPLVAYQWHGERTLVPTHYIAAR